MASPRIKPGRMSKTGSRPYLEAQTAPSAHWAFKVAATASLQGYVAGQRAIEWMGNKSRARSETPLSE